MLRLVFKLCRLATNHRPCLTIVPEPEQSQESERGSSFFSHNILHVNLALSYYSIGTVHAFITHNVIVYILYIIYTVYTNISTTLSLVCISYSCIKISNWTIMYGVAILNGSK